jgi:hypothetical protein
MKNKSLLPPFTLRVRDRSGSETKGRNYPSLAKRGEGRFSEQYVYSIMDSLVIHSRHQVTRHRELFTPWGSSTIRIKTDGNLAAVLRAPEINIRRDVVIGRYFTRRRMTEIISTWVNEKIWGGTYMSVLDDLKKLLNKVL